MITRVDHAEILARDVSVTVKFYTEVLGFDIARWGKAEIDQHNVIEIACLTLGDFMVEIIQATPEAVNEPVDQARVGMKMLALRVDDMAGTIQKLIEMGVGIVQAPRQSVFFNGLRAEIMDPNGIAVELREWQNDAIDNRDWYPTNGSVTVIK
jgi:lactoylglutathione lyase/glyoxylase I family protein